MASKRSRGPRLLDTSAVVYHLHGHTLQQDAVREEVAGGEVLVPVFVRTEYLRGEPNGDMHNNGSTYRPAWEIAGPTTRCSFSPSERNGIG